MAILVIIGIHGWRLYVVFVMCWILREFGTKDNSKSEAKTE